MKKILVVIFLLALALPAVLFIGYYETSWAEDNTPIFFIKNKPTFQVSFGNIFATDSDGKKLHELTDKQRKNVINFCKYFLGIETELRIQEEMDACEQAYYATFKKKPLNYINHESWDVEPE